MSDFNRVASFYDVLKKIVFQSTLDRASTAFLEKIPTHSKILVVGGGSGVILSHFHPTHELIYLEKSKKMIELAEVRNFQASVLFENADVRDYQSQHQFDCIITPFVLDCFRPSELEDVFDKLSKFLKPKGIWLHADFYPQNWRHKLLVSIMYFFFRISSGLKVRNIPNFELLFNKYKFIEKKNHPFKYGLIQSKYYLKIEA